MRIEFLYLRKGENTFPLVDVELIGPRGSLVVKALLDSGASMSLFRAEIAYYLGVAVREGEALSLQGIRGSVMAYRHKIPVRVGQEKLDCEIAFASQIETSFNLLGRNNFFLPFLITFDEKLQKVIVETNPQAEAR